MNTVYTPVGIGKTEREYDNAVGQQAMYELAVSENPDYASLASRGSGPPYPPPSQFVDVEYDEASGGLVREAEEEAEQLEGDYIQTAGAEDTGIARNVVLQLDQPTYHYVEPSALEPKEDGQTRTRWVRWLIISLILLISFGIGATALVLVSKNDSPGTKPLTAASTGDSPPTVPPGIVASFILEECPQGWMRLQGQYVDVRLAGAAPAFVNDNPLRAGLVLPDMENERLFVRPSSASTNVGTVEDDSTSAKGLSVSSVSVWGTTHKRITYVSDDNAEGLLFVDEATAPVESTATETRPKSISLLYCVKV